MGGLLPDFGEIRGKTAQKLEVLVHDQMVSSDLDLTVRRARLAVALAFATQGGVFISLTTRLPEVSKRWDFSELELSGVLLMMVLLAGIGSIVSEVLAKKTDSAMLLRSGLAAIAIGVPLIALAPHMYVFIAGMAIYGTALGVVDASTNMQAVAIERRYGRPILPSFHGAWTLGGVIGSGITLLTARLPFELTAVLAIIPLVVLFSPFLRRVGMPRSIGSVSIPWRPIMLVGIALVLFYMVDTAAFTWGPTYLDKVFDAPSTLVALATFPYLLASGAMRWAGDHLVGRFGPTPVLQVGSIIAAASLGIIVFAPTWQIAVVGFTTLGTGVAVIAPLSFSAAARIAGENANLDEHSRQAMVDSVIARFNQFNYAGALLGAVLTGVVGSGNLRIGFAVPMVLVLGIIPLARIFAQGAFDLTDNTSNSRGDTGV